MTGRPARPDAPHPARGSVAVLGGGISGLAVAHELTKIGATVTVFEGSAQLGGLGTFFEHEGRTHERFYHVVLPSDRHLLGLMEEIGEPAPTWTRSTFGVVHDGTHYPLNSPRDLLRYQALPLGDRLRLGVTALAGRWTRYRPELDTLTAKEWLVSLSGPRAFDRFWRPLLEAKFGDAYEAVPALWYWTRFQREKATRDEVKGYPRGGYHGLTAALASSLRARGVRLSVMSPVRSVALAPDGRCVVGTDRGMERFDRLVCTLPMAVFRTLTGHDALGRAAASAPGPVDYQGVVNVVLISDQSCSSHYWTAVVDSDAPFAGVVETTRVVPAEESGERHLIYLLNYLHRDDQRFLAAPEDIVRDYTQAFLRIYPEFPASAIRATRVFKAPWVEPHYTPGYLQRRPPVALVPGRVYLSTAAQVYPDVTSWNGCVGQAKATVSRLASGHGRTL